ncbi:GTP-binding protein [Encephalitozoon hellem ATCC 50504]|uniref:Ribosome biogenesis GTPase A n=1 Tax=Encephalitozoon hellem TaxID=27973 RepID=A0A9Q9C4U6_ENCHE|nr:GTP-binding protein [Encephalitozoon hellem ATCC 50504]AFM98721.1 GTP-binding protein [Encephalitozoon hellem ATCC 50504]UTX43695.1 ribosome biogenesis GTPase A [Encephalitozoon hellem]|eukprot:XP_003887702.1 GTP-binding protein [Encephalitozoon hellem ATCC 50504]
MKIEWGKLIIERRFGMKQKIKPRVQRGSATEYGGVEKLSEELAIRNKKISGGKPARVLEESEEQSDVDIAVEGLIPSLELSKTIPPRVPYDKIEKELFKDVESKIFDLWKGRQRCGVFERNIEIWRQLWITCERSDVIIQIVDARNPKFFLNDDIRKLYPEKEHVVLINKADLSSNRTEIKEYRCFYYSALEKNNLLKFILEYKGKVVGFVGYPNVGKSSTINSIVSSKRVRVSQTPGKTRHIQTIHIDGGPRLLDCPGLVFPRHNKIDLILHGILNVDQLLDLSGSAEYIVEFIGIGKLCKFYSLKGFYNDSRYSRSTNYMNLMSMTKGWEASRCLKTIVKDFVSGKIPYDRTDEDTPRAMFDWYEKEIAP